MIAILLKRIEQWSIRAHWSCAGPVIGSGWAIPMDKFNHAPKV